MTELFSFNIPRRWRIAHLYQAILNEEDYEKNTGTVIVEIFLERCLEPFAIPGVICASHGLFAWGWDAA